MIERDDDTTLREGWQRCELGLQKPKRLGERRMERTRWIFFREYAGIFEVFFFKKKKFVFFNIILILFNLMWHSKTQVPRHVAP
jgi:hypothetical protein